MKALFLLAGRSSTPSTRYRVLQYVPHLEARGIGCTLQYPSSTSSVAELSRYWLRTLVLAKDHDAVVVQKRLDRFVPLIKLVNPHVVFDFDDALFAPHPLVDSQWVAERRAHRLREILSISSRVVVGNDFLASYARPFNPRVSVLPTPVDTDQYRPVEEPKRETGMVTLGWVGGTDNLGFLDMLRPVVHALAKRFAGQVSLVFVSGRSMSFTGVATEGRIWREGDEAANFAGIDVGLMPLSDDSWTRGKCAFKALQYMALGIPTVASPVGANSQVIADGVSGFLPRSDAEWFDTLSALVTSPRLRRQVGLSGRQVVVDRYSLRLSVPRLIEVIRRAVEE